MIGIFLDIETNGLNPFKHRILQIAFKIIELENGTELYKYEAVIAQDKNNWRLSDPSSLKINNFSYEEIRKGKPASMVAIEIINIFQAHHLIRGKSVFICQNPSFDRAFFGQLIDPDMQESMRWPYYWLDLASMYWAESIRKGRQHSSSLPWVTGFSKDNIATVYHLPLESKPHRAMNGVDHLLLCYKAVIGFADRTSDC